MNRNHMNSTRAQQELRHFESLSEQFRKTWLIALLGCLQFLAGIFVLIWNEGRAVETTKTLEEAILSIVPVNADFPVAKENDGKLIYLTGEIFVQEPLTDVSYGVSVMAVKLKRRVQMYQWIEEESLPMEGDSSHMQTSTYYYYTEWKDKLVDTSLFHTSMGHGNPQQFPLKSVTQVNDVVKVGSYELGAQLKDKFSDYISITSDERPESKDIKLHAGLYYHSQDVWNPQVGDIRIQFSYSGQHGDVVTIVALQSNGQLLPFQSRLGLSVLILRIGRFSLEDVFMSEHAQNHIKTWMWRVLGWVLLYLGCVCLASILRILVTRSRALRQLLPTGNASLKMTVSTCVSLVVTAVAWAWYRPMLGLCLIMVTMVLMYVSKWISDDSRAAYQRL